MSFFGPQRSESALSTNEDMDEDETACTSRSSPRPRKHGRENNSNGLSLEPPLLRPPPKKPRRSNETVTSTNGDHMEIEANGYPSPEAIVNNNHQSPIRSPAGDVAHDTNMELDGEGDDEEIDGITLQEQATMTLTNGNSVGVQSDKVAELGPETTVLDVAGRSVLHTHWNPRHADILATGGDALCRIWDVSATGSHQQYTDVLDQPDESRVTTMAWSPDGERLAVAASDGINWVGNVMLRTKHGQEWDNLPAASDMVSHLRWNPSGSHLLGVTSGGNGKSVLLVWSVEESCPLRTYELNHQVFDAVWSGDEAFTVCGDNILADFYIDDQSIVLVQYRTEGDFDRVWCLTVFDATTRTTAVASEETHQIALLDSGGNFSAVAQHEGEITAMLFQPTPSYSLLKPPFTRLLATASLDSNIKLWNVKSTPTQLVQTLSLGKSSPAMALSFTLDGNLMAAAHANRVCVWDPELGSRPKASWKGKPGQWFGTANGMDNDSGIEEEESHHHSLSWDASGQKLAFGLGSQVRPDSGLILDMPIRTNHHCRWLS